MHKAKKFTNPWWERESSWSLKKSSKIIKKNNINKYFEQNLNCNNPRKIKKYNIDFKQ